MRKFPLCSFPFFTIFSIAKGWKNRITLQHSFYPDRHYVVLLKIVFDDVAASCSLARSMECDDDAENCEFSVGFGEGSF